MLDVTDRDIAALGDADLRALVARLVEATLRSRSLPTAAITWGGDQNAADGGLDVRVELGVDATVSGFVPRPSTGFQVKKPKMAPAAIRAEMSPNGKLRGSIAKLAERGGAYIIVSSGSDLSDSELTRRLQAMRLAVADHPSAHRLTVDYYDRQRLATWARDFPALSPWVLAKVGRPMQGWRSYENWTSVGMGAPAEFVVDDMARLFDGTIRPQGSEAGMPILAGLQRMRTVLASPRASARLVGLSGVGKTRLVEALFDERIGTDALDPARAVYADMGADPEPSPMAIATYLLQRGAPSIVIVDNCPADLHRRLTEICRALGSTVSVLTVEYDIRDDSPEGTEVFRLEAASPELVAKIVRAQCPWVSQVDAGTIGTFSGGNSRVGLALAHTLQAGESLSGLSDEALFVRLFHQRHPDDSGLLSGAEACALVYSFEGEILEGDHSELGRLAVLADCPTTTLHRHVAELSRRGLLQRRSRWRAVLPHAIANRLARRALENVPSQQLHEQLVLAPERLLRSYSRRIGYLHDSEVAIRIVHDWLSASGLLGPYIANLNSLGIAMLINVAPVAPEFVLSAIERVQLEGSAANFFSTSNPHRDEFVELLRKIAYDADLFERCAALLVRFALLAQQAGKMRGDAALDAWPSLFSPFLSGTHAPVERRLRVIESLMWADTPGEHQLAIKALTAALETFHFSSGRDFSFGSRSRDYGYHPTTREEQTAWYSTCMRTARMVGTSAAPGGPKVREAFAQQLPGLWVHTSTQDVIEQTVGAFATEGFWEDGWVAVKEALWRCIGQPTDEAQTRLTALEVRLAPKTLEEKIRVYVLRDAAWVLDAEEQPGGAAQAMKHADNRAEELGRCLAGEAELFGQLLPAIMGKGTGRRWHLARGLAHAANDRRTLWLKLVDAAANAGDDANIILLDGYLSAWSKLDPAASRTVLEDAVTNPKLIQWAPQLEVAAGLDGSSVARLHRALAAGAPAWAFKILMFGRLTDAISTVDLCSLLSGIAAVPGGWTVAVNILAMRLSSGAGDRTNLDQLRKVGRGFLLRFDPAQHRDLDHDLGTLTSFCLMGAAGQAIAAAVCQSLAKAFGNRSISFYDLHDFVRAIFRVQPMAALNAFLQPPPEYQQRYPTVLSMFEDVARYHRHPISEIDDEVILKWCAEDPGRGFVAAATTIPYSRASSNGAGIEWTELALKLLQRAPEPRDVLRTFVARFTPHSWSGSRAAIIEANAQLLTMQEESGSANLAHMARQERERLLSEAREERRWESNRSRREDERFE